MTFVCKECSYPSLSPDNCDNPACLSNPTLSENHKINLRANVEKVAKEKAKYEARKAFRKSLKKSGFTPTF